MCSSHVRPPPTRDLRLALANMLTGIGPVPASPGICCRKNTLYRAGEVPENAHRHYFTRMRRAKA